MTLQEALDWVNRKGREFEEAGPRIMAGRERAAVVARALPRGSAERAEAGATVNRWSELLADWTSARNRWNRIASHIPGLEPGLGVVPVVPLALAGAVIAVAVSMAVILRKLTAEERALALLESGQISAAEAIELAENLEGARGGFGLGLGLSAPVVIGAAALAFFLMRR